MRTTLLLRVPITIFLLTLLLGFVEIRVVGSFVLQNMNMHIGYTTATNTNANTNKHNTGNVIHIQTRQYVYREDNNNADNIDSNDDSRNRTREELRVQNLERLVASQSVEISRLKTSIAKMNDVFGKVQNFFSVLEKAGLDLEDEDLDAIQIEFEMEFDDEDNGSNSSSREDIENVDDNRSQEQEQMMSSNSNSIKRDIDVEYVEDIEMEIFGSAPNSVTEAADSAGAAVLAALLAGKLRMLVGK